MGRSSSRTENTVAVVLFFLLPLLASCINGNGDTAQPLAAPSELADEAVPPPEPEKDVVITIGNLTDITGPSSNAMTVITMALEDMVEYYNEQNLIPGVELKVISYDEQADPSRDIAGYEWLKESGADLIFTPIPFVPTILKPKINKDEFMLFAFSGDTATIEPPGYVFSLGTIPQHEAITLLKWIAENDPDFPADRPAKIGGAAWTEGYSSSWFAGAEAYAKAHPDQFEWVGGYLTDFTFVWGAEVEALKDCDYVYPSVVLHTFVREYRAAGYTGKFICTSAQTAFFGLIYDSNLWEEIDKSLFILPAKWWNEEGTMINVIRDLLNEKRPNDVEEIMQKGMGYLAGVIVDLMLSIIANAVDAVGPENFNSKALHDAAESFSRTIDGVPRYSFGEDKRWMIDLYAVYEASSVDEDIFRIDPEWLPVVTTP